MDVGEKESKIKQTDPSEILEKNVNDVVKRKISYLLLCPADRSLPWVHKLLLEKKIIADSLNGYDVITDSFFVDEFYATKEGDTGFINQNNSITNGDIDIPKCPFKGFGYGCSPRLFFKSFAEYYEYMDGQIYSEKSTFYGYSFSNEDIKKYKIALDKINFGDGIYYNVDDYIEEAGNVLDFNEMKKIKKKNDKQIDNEIETLILNLIKSSSYIKFQNRIIDWTCSHDLNYYKKNMLLNSEEFKASFFAEVNLNKNKEILKYALYSAFFSNWSDDWLYIIGRGLGIDVLWDFYSYLKKTFTIKNLSTDNLRTLRRLYASFHTDEELFELMKTKIERIETKVGDAVPYQDDEEDILDCENCGQKNLYSEDIYGNKGINLYIYKWSDVIKPLSKRSQKRNDIFVVLLRYESNNELLLERKFRFNLFSSFVYFLNFNLDGANLVTCTGLNNIKDWSNISLNNAYYDSKLSINEINTEKDSYFTEHVETKSLKYTIEREVPWTHAQEQLYPVGNFDPTTTTRLFYISDLHLEQRLEEMGAKTKADIYICLTKIIDNLFSFEEGKAYHDIVVINGDTCHNYGLFRDFVNLLPIREEHKCKLQIVFTLGNHEYWDDKVNRKNYKSLVQSKGYYLLDNSVLYYDIDLVPHTISEKKLTEMNNEQLKNEFLNANTILFGGTGFAGFNDKFNADSGIYNHAITRNQEIAESKKFNELYEKVCECAIGKNVIIVTHMPKSDWSGNDEYHKGYIYLNGHTHLNDLYLSDEYSIYANNQIGYNKTDSSLPVLKYFFYSVGGDIYEDYKDGQYIISAQQYKDFMRNKNFVIEFNREYDNIYMLKEEGYYCFIGESDEGIFVLDGGRRIRLCPYDIEYYSANMHSVIGTLTKDNGESESHKKIREISNTIMELGGNGKVSGNSIKIDTQCSIKIKYIWDNGQVSEQFYPVKYCGSSEGYVIYQSIELLLKNECADLYDKFVDAGGKIAFPLFAIKANGIAQESMQIDWETYRKNRTRTYKPNSYDIPKVDKGVINYWVYKSIAERRGNIQMYNHHGIKIGFSHTERIVPKREILDRRMRIKSD